MKYMGLKAIAPRSQRKAKQARAKRRETWMAGLGGRAGSNSLKLGGGNALFKHARGIGVHRKG